jgi:hypothetical protein
MNAAQRKREEALAFFKKVEAARLGRFAKTPEARWAYSTARALELAAGVKGGAGIEAAAGEVARRAKRARAQVGPKTVRAIREARRELLGRLRGTRPKGPYVAPATVALLRAHATLAAELGRHPTRRELAQRTGLFPTHISREARRLGLAFSRGTWARIPRRR